MSLFSNNSARRTRVQSSLCARGENGNPVRDTFQGVHAAPSPPIDLSKAFRRERNYIMVITGRCGSTWLGRLLKQARCGDPREFFSNDGGRTFYDRVAAVDLFDYAAKLSERFAPGGVFGFQQTGRRLRWLGEIVDIPRSFKNFVWFDMRRRNFVAQAFSFERALQTGQWHLNPGDEQADAAVEYSDERVLARIRSILTEEAMNDEFYGELGVAPCRIFYEDLVCGKAVTLVRIVQEILGAPPSDFKAPRDETKPFLPASREEADFARRHAGTIAELYRLHR